MSTLAAKGAEVPGFAVSAITVDHEAVGVEIVVNNWSYRQDAIFEEFFTGISKCDPVDKFDPQLGVELAYWRAVERAAKKNLDRLSGLIKHRDDLRDSKESTNFLGVNFSIEEETGCFLINGKRVNGLLKTTRLCKPYAVTFGANSREDFIGKTGYVVAECPNDIGDVIVYHPEVNWFGQFATYWNQYNLDLS